MLPLDTYLMTETSGKVIHFMYGGGQHTAVVDIFEEVIYYAQTCIIHLQQFPTKISKMEAYNIILIKRHIELKCMSN